MCESLAQNTWIWFIYVQKAMVLVFIDLGYQMTQLWSYGLKVIEFKLKQKCSNSHMNF